jgi:hypothetical protein
MLLLRSKNATDHSYSTNLVLFVLNRSAFPPLYETIPSEAGHRYSNIIVGSLGSWEFYAHSFTAESCHRLFLVPAVFRGSFYNMAILRGIERKRSVYGYGFTNDNWFTVGCNLSPYRYWPTTSHISLISLERTPFPARIRPWGLCYFVHLFLRPQ